MRAAASVIDFVAMLCETSTRYTIESRDEPAEITGRASARASAARSSERTAACRNRWRLLKLVRLKRSATQTAGSATSSHNAPAAVQLMFMSHRDAALPRPPLRRHQHKP